MQKKSPLLVSSNLKTSFQRVNDIILEFADMKLEKGAGVELSDDKNRLEEYYQIRRDSYVRDKFMDGHFNQGKPDDYDRISDMMLVVQNDKCLGGARLTSTVPDNRIFLPTESNNFNFEDALPELPLKYCGYAEIHRFVLERSSRAMGFLESLIWCSYIWCVEQGISYLMSPSVPLRTRMYKKACDKLGLTITVRKDIVIREEKYSNVDMYLMIMDVRNQPYHDYVKYIVDSRKRSSLFFRGSSCQQPSADFDALVNDTQRNF